MYRIRSVLGAAALLLSASSLAAMAQQPSAPAPQSKPAAAPSTAQQGPSSATGAPQPAANASRNAVSDETKKHSEHGASGSSTAEATPGRTSFTEGQAKSRIEDSGFRDVTGLKKDDHGIWTGQAMKDGKQVTVQLDFQGDVLVRP